SRITFPEVGRSSPASNPSRVVLPLPEGPTMARKPPDSSSRVISLRTVRSWPPDWYEWLIPCAARIGPEEEPVDDEIAVTCVRGKLVLVAGPRLRRRCRARR